SYPRNHDIGLARDGTELTPGAAVQPRPSPHADAVELARLGIARREVAADAGEAHLGGEAAAEIVGGRYGQAREGAGAPTQFVREREHLAIAVAAIEPQEPFHRRALAGEVAAQVLRGGVPIEVILVLRYVGEAATQPGQGARGVAQSGERIAVRRVLLACRHE